MISLRATIPKRPLSIADGWILGTRPRTKVARMMGDQETHRTERKILCDEYKMSRKSDENEKKMDEEERNHKEYEIIAK